MCQRDLLRVSDLDQLVVDQADVLCTQLALDVLEKLLVEIVCQVLVGGPVALVEFGEIEIDLEAVDVPADARDFNTFDWNELNELNEASLMEGRSVG